MSSTPVRRAVVRVTAVLGVVGLCGAAWAVPAVRSTLRDSFTERQQTYIELYFAKDPWFDGGELVVPLDLVEHGASGGRHVVEVRAEDGKGRRLSGRTRAVTTKPGALKDIDIRLPLKGDKRRDVESVEVTLTGHPQRLRMHIR
ncbi:hypothetical protein ACFZDJ_41175 [Streptomyces sp. NPDC007896]|uniref:hypothetical protein n=1 Tax=Streptomyces sp. NPDC007896 TaxID=3364784 RepID=UPI0036E8ECAF